MPFLSLTDPADLARAQTALEAAWIEMKPAIPEADHKRERTELAYCIAALVGGAAAGDELKDRAIERYRNARASRSADPS